MPTGIYTHKPPSVATRKKMSNAHLGSRPWNKGKNLSEETKIKMRKSAHIGSQSFCWKGDGASYRAKHQWVVRQKGKPKKCFLCGKKSGRLHWANIDHKYKRKEADYISLCPKCHGHYDKVNRLRKNV